MTTDASATGDVSAPRVPPAVILGSAFFALAGMVVGYNDPTSVVSLALWGLATAILLLGVPRELVLGTGLATAVAIAFTIGPINAPKAALYIATIGVSVVIVTALLREGGASGRPRSVVALLLGLAYFFLLFLSTVLTGLGLELVDLVVLIIAPSLLALLIARRMTGQNFRVFARGFVVFAVFQVAVSTIDLLFMPIPFFGYAIVSGTRLSNSLLFDAVFREQGLAGHPIVMALILVVAIVLLWRNSAELSNAGRIIVLALLVWGLVISGTRSAIVALVAGILFLAIVNARTLGARLRNLGLVVVVTALALTNSVVFSYVASVATGLSESGSYSHRAGALEAVPGLINGLPIGRLFFGSGAGSEPVLFASGFLQQDGFNIIDNQFVTTLVSVGLIGLALIAILIVRTLLLGTPTTRGLLVVMVVMMNSFDLLRWTGPAIVFFAIVALADSHMIGRESTRSPDVEQAYAPKAGSLRVPAAAAYPRRSD
jgi:hypothetical protein